ncbi:MAG: cation-efflux pump [Proteobacteria bacterium]|nr:cation-efflux pump [Pseudomonadota bacterium]
MQDEKRRVALGSIVASAGLTIAKGIVGALTGSLAILSEAAHSLIDLAATVMTYFAVRASGKPADEEHHYGHDKIESLTALAETALLFVLSGVVAWEAAQRLFVGHPRAVEATFAAFAVIVISIVVDFFRARLLYRVAADTKSEALEADALHFGSDLWSSAAVLIGLVGIALGYAWADSLAALMVAIFICIAGWRLGRRTIDSLTDTAPAGAAERIRAIARKIGGVVAVDRVRVRAAGARLFIDLDVAASRTLPLERATTLQSQIVAALRAQMGDADIAVTVTPRALSDETVRDRVIVIAHNLALPVHHVTVHAIGTRLSVSLDLEVEGALTLLAAHDVASGLEAAIKEELGPDVEVETHIEPLQPHGMAGSDAPAGRAEAVRTTLVGLAPPTSALRDVHNVRVRDTQDGEIVNFHCRVAPSLTVDEVHARVDDLERALRARYPEIKRVIGHAEPIRVASDASRGDAPGDAPPVNAPP